MEDASPLPLPRPRPPQAPAQVDTRGGRRRPSSCRRCRSRTSWSSSALRATSRSRCWRTTSAKRAASKSSCTNTCESWNSPTTIWNEPNGNNTPPRRERGNHTAVIGFKINASLSKACSIDCFIPFPSPLLLLLLWSPGRPSCPWRTSSSA